MYYLIVTNNQNCNQYLQICTTKQSISTFWTIEIAKITSHHPYFQYANLCKFCKRMIQSSPRPCADLSDQTIESRKLKLNLHHFRFHLQLQNRNHPPLHPTWISWFSVECSMKQFDLGFEASRYKQNSRMKTTFQRLCSYVKQAIALKY